MTADSLDPRYNNNDLTLRTYHQTIQKYIDSTPPVDSTVKAWIDKSLSFATKDAKIFEIGSGHGQEAEYIRSRGYKIECSDAIPGFVEILKSKGLDAHLFNALKDSLESTYHIIFAIAVLHHFSPDEATLIARKIYVALDSSGVFAFRVKLGDGSEWSNTKVDGPRYYHYWQPAQLKKMLSECGFKHIETSEDYRNHSAVWVGVIASKVTDS